MGVLWDGEVKAVGGKFVVLFLSENVKAVGKKIHCGIIARERTRG